MYGKERLFVIFGIFLEKTIQARQQQKTIVETRSSPPTSGSNWKEAQRSRRSGK
jgi:hypothetical protein